MKSNIPEIEMKKPRPSFLNIDYTQSQTLSRSESTINKMVLILWWSLYIQLLPGIYIQITKKMKRNIRIINANKVKSIKIRHHVVFTLIPGTFFSLYKVKG
jgi:hypothetical protein